MQRDQSYRWIWWVAVLHAAAVGSIHAQAPVVCEPLDQRAGRELGCFITAHVSLGALPRDTALFWLLDSFPTVAAATAAQSARGVVVQSFGTAWLFTIGPKSWRAPTGQHVATIGPLPLVPADSFTFLALESTLAPGMGTSLHRHSGAEAFLTIAGEMCVETPTGVLRQRPGDAAIVLPAGTPMILTSTGMATRQSLAILLHDASQPRSANVSEWTPRGLCAPAR